MEAEGFWRFAHERQAIWHRRFVEYAPQPWTDDPILRAYRFTNVHRELDAGTIVLLERVQARAASREAIVFNTMLYRVFNNYGAWVECDPFCTTRDEIDEAFSRLRTRWEAKRTIFTAAWTLGQLPYAGRDRLEKIRTAIRDWDAYQLTRDLTEAGSLISAAKILMGQKLIGSFTAFQIALDMSYIMPFTDDEPLPVFYVGTGKDLTRAPSGSGSALLQLETTVEALRDDQDRALAELGLDWGAVAWEAKPRLTMADIEHTLCEFMKYTKMCGGNVRGQRKYGA
jgi:hypothetical protein